MMLYAVLLSVAKEDKVHQWSWPHDISWRSAFPVLILLVSLLLPACGAATAPAKEAPAAPTPSPTSTPVPTQQVMFVTTDQVTLYGTLYGSGTWAIILSNEGDNNTSAWIPIAEQLAARGYLVLGYSYRREVATANGLPSQALTDLRAAIAFMRGRHPSGITLMGSSLGGLISIKEATVEKFDALVSISALAAFEDVQVSDSELRRITTPKLFVTSELNDPFTSDTYHMFAVTPQPKEERAYPGRDHGLALFQDSSGPDLMSTLLQLLQHYAPVS
jgi:dienelactone hydrolase